MPSSPDSPIWREDDSESPDARMATMNALEQMAAEAAEADQVEEEEEEEDDDDDDDDQDFDIADMEQVLAADDDDLDDLDDDEYFEDAMEEDEDDDDDDDAGIETDGYAAIVRSFQRWAAQQSNTADQESEDAPGTRSTRAARIIGTANLRRLFLNTARLGRGVPLHDDDDEEQDDDDDEDYADEDDDDTEPNWYGFVKATDMKDFWDPVDGPIEAGQQVAFSGDFGRAPTRPLGCPPSAFTPSRSIADRIYARKTALARISKTEMDDLIPNSRGTEVARYPARVYCGQYSQDSSFFYTCTQDFRVQMYDTTVAPSREVLKLNDRTGFRHSAYYTSFGTTQYTSLKPIRTIQGRMGNWTITDANLSPDNQWMIYSSITPVVHLVPTKVEPGIRTDASDRQVPLDFSDVDDSEAPHSGIWSIKFSSDSREIVAGGHYGDIYVYDIEARRRVLRVPAHRDDVNSVAFADSFSSNVLISGSDDSYVKVWDRRSLSAGGKAAGVLPGHTEGITHISPKGDGRYCISNGKDQSLRLWDLRTMRSSDDMGSISRKDYGLRNWDYRNMSYRKPRFQAHPDDCSVMTYRGHAVLRTLIRCYFSPQATTGQKYIYSGSADGRIHIWSLDGQVVQVLDRSKTIDIFADDVNATDPSAAEGSHRGGFSERQAPRDVTENAGPSISGGNFVGSMGRRRIHHGITVRDVAWHSSEPSIMSTAWDGQDQERGSVAKHEWKGYGKSMRLEDAVQRTREEEAERSPVRV